MPRTVPPTSSPGSEVDPSGRPHADEIAVPLPGVGEILAVDVGESAQPRMLRTPGWLRIVVGIIGGPALVYAALDAMTHVTAEIRFIPGFTGAILFLVGVDAVVKRRFGPTAKAGVWFAAAWIVLVVVAAGVADLLPLAESRNASRTFEEPILASPDLWSSHPLGTDRQGLDILGGIIYGFRVSLVIGLGTVGIGVIVGGTIGMIAAYYRRHVDRYISFFTNSLLAFPPLILLLGVAAVMDRNVRNLTLALALVTIPTYIRLARANTLVVCQREFVLAARSLGAKSRHIILRDIAPSVVRPMLSYAFVVIAVIIVAEASLSFLGLGIPRPEPTLGNLISAGQRDFERYPHLVFGPAIALFLTVLSLNRLGEEAQRRLSGREAKI